MPLDMSLLAESVVQLLAVVLLAPLYVGIANRLKSIIETKQGASIFQLYYDIMKLLKKETVLPENSGAVFLYAPYAAFGIYCLIAIVIPVVLPTPIYLTATVDFLGGALLFGLAGFIKMLSAMDTGSNFTALCGARASSFSMFAEGSLILVFFAVALITGTNNPYVTNGYLVQNPGAYITLAHIFATVAFIMIFIFESGRLPVESSGLMELGMIDDGLVYEHSGKLLGISKWGSYIKQYLLGSALLNVFLLPWGLQTGVLGALEDIPIMFVKWMALIAALTVIETTYAKVRLFKVQDYLSVAFSMSLLFLILSLVAV